MRVAGIRFGDGIELMHGVHLTLPAQVKRIGPANGQHLPAHTVLLDLKVLARQPNAVMRVNV